MVSEIKTTTNNTANGIKALPPGRMYVDELGNVDNTLKPIVDKVDSLTDYDVFGEDILKVDSLGNPALNDAQVSSVNKPISVSQKTKATPLKLAQTLGKKPFAEVNDAISQLEKEMAGYKKQGVSIIFDETGKSGRRVSNNEQWYSDFFRKNKRAPRKHELKEIAENRVMNDIAKSGGEFVSKETATGYKLVSDVMDAARKIGDNAFKCKIRRG